MRVKTNIFLEERVAYTGAEMRDSLETPRISSLV